MKLEYSPEINTEDVSAPELEKLSTNLENKDYEKTIAILKVIAPEGEKEEYIEEVYANLSNDAREIQIRQNRLVEDPEKTEEEIKDLLVSKLKSALNDARKGIRVDEFLLRRARLALLSVNDYEDLSLHNSDPAEKLNMQELKHYIEGRDKSKRLSEEEIDFLLATKFRKNITDSRYSEYLHKDYGTIESVSGNLMIGFSQSTASDRYYAIEEGLEQAEKSKYNQEVLRHLIATEYSKLCFKNSEKFQDGALEELIRCGNLNDDETIPYLISLSLPQDQFENLVDLYVKHNSTYKIKDTRGTYYDKNRNVITLPYGDILEQCRDIEFDSKGEIEEGKKIETIRELVENGYVSFAIHGHETKKLLHTYISSHYEEFSDHIKKYDQEHLVFGHLNEEDRRLYIKKLIENDKPHMVVKTLRSLVTHHSSDHFLDKDVFIFLKDSGFVEDLRSDYSKFKNLSEATALELIRNNDTQTFLKNIKSFDVTQEFLRAEEVQDACFSEFKANIRSWDPATGKAISDKIPFDTEKMQEEIYQTVFNKLFMYYDGIGLACNVIQQFPEIKPLLDTEQFHKKVTEELIQRSQKEYIQIVAQIVDSFPLPESLVKNEKLAADLTKLIQKDWLATTYGQGDFYDFAKFRKTYEYAETINTYIPLPNYILEMRGFVEQIQAMETEPIDIRNEFAKRVVSSTDPESSLKKQNSLYEEVKSNKTITLDKGIAAAYIEEFFDGGSEEQKALFFKQIQNDIKTIAQNKPLTKETKYYTYVVQEVYPKRNYDTYKFMDEYEDRSKDLDKYVFEKDGYEMKLSGVLGYKVIDGQVTNPELINEFSERIDTIKNIAEIDALTTFLEDAITESKTHTIEGKILEYFKENGYTIDTMNVLLAYQLLGSYDTFVSNSADRASSEENEVSKNYILLDELVNQYGDTMKETIKAIQEKVANSEDKELFTVVFNEKYEKKYNDVINIVVKDLQKIPKEKIIDSTVQKKISKTMKNVFQGLPEIQTKADEFSTLFNATDFDNLQEVWTRRLNEFFTIDETSRIDTQKVESLQSSIFNRLQNEIGKYEEIKEVDDERGEEKLKKDRIIKGYFSKTKENAHARMVADVCIASDPNMLKSENYFEFVLFDENRNKCMGTVMLLEMPEPQDDKKYLLYCPNPSVGLVSEVSAKKLYQLLSKKIFDFASENNFDGVLVNKSHGQSTNRGGLFQQSLEQSCLKDPSGQERKISLKNSHSLSRYTYQNDLQIVWEK